MNASICIRPPVAGDLDRWLPLWRDYCAFYRTTLPDAVTFATWERLIAVDGAVRGLVAERDGGLAGFATYLFHPSTWSLQPYCYLEDLFTAADQRRGGVAQALIGGVAEDARRAGSPRLYCLTQEDNAIARVVYDRVAIRSGFIQYRLPVDISPRRTQATDPA